MLQSKEGFIGAFNQINILKARCHRAMGNKEMADEIMANLDFNVDINSSVKLIQEAYADNDYLTTTSYYHGIENYFSENKEVKLKYNELESFFAKFPGLTRHDVNYLLALGTISYINLGQLTKAEEALSFLQDFQNKLAKHYNDKKQAGEDFDYSVYKEIEKCESLVYMVKGCLQQRKGKFALALEHFNKAIELDENAVLSSDTHLKYELWLQFTKASLLISMEQYAEANILLRKMNDSYRFPRSIGEDYNKGFSKKEYRFLKTYLRYKMKDYNGSLMGLNILKTNYPDVAKYYILEQQIYTALGDSENAEKAKTNYINKITSRQ